VVPGIDATTRNKWKARYVGVRLVIGARARTEAENAEFERNVRALGARAFI
jgi:hypothetical protein